MSPSGGIGRRAWFATMWPNPWLSGSDPRLGDHFLIRLPDAVLYYYMPKKTKTKRKKSKPGPPEERLIIRGNPQDAIDMLLKKKPKQK